MGSAVVTQRPVPVPVHEARSYRLSNGQRVDLIAAAGSWRESDGWRLIDDAQDLSVGQIAYVWYRGDWRKGVISKLGHLRAVIALVPLADVRLIEYPGVSTVQVITRVEYIEGVLVGASRVMAPAVAVSDHAIAS